MRKIIFALFSAAMLIAMALPATATPFVAAIDAGGKVEVQLAMILDGSDSISSSNWTVMLDGLAAAVENPDCIPQDGSVELTVIQFSTNAQIEVGPVVITGANAGDVANDIRNISQMKWATCISCGICLAADTLAASDNFDPDIKQALNLVTDGMPNRCSCADSSCGYSGSHCTGYEAWASAECARAYALDKLNMTDDQDEFDAEGIDITDRYRDWLRDYIVWPQPGYIAPLFDQGPGWVRVVEDIEEFAETICEKFEIILSGSITAHKFHDLNGDGDQDGGEEDLSGWTMTLYSGSDCSGSSLDSGITNGNGNLVFTGLEAGTYSVKETLKGGWTNTTARCQPVTIATAESAALNFGNRCIPPTADFSGSPARGCAPLTVNFNDLSTGSPTSWSWSFPGGSPSSHTGQTPPPVTYNGVGTYTVSLTVNNGCGSDSEIKTNYITVAECVCQNNLTVTSDDCCSITVGDLGTVDPGTTETFSVACGTDVTLNAHENECCDFVNWTGDVPGGSSNTNPITIHVDSDKSVTGHCTGVPAPMANFSAEPTSGCAPLTVVFTDTSTGNPTSWSWSFLGGNPSGAMSQGPHKVTYNSPGTYTVSLTINNGCGEDTETKTGYITVRDCTPRPSAGGGCPRMKRLTVDWEGNNTTKPLYSNDKLAVDLLGPSLDLSHSLFLERGTHAPIVDERTYYLIVVRELEETPAPPENTVALVVFNITPADAEFDRDIFLTLGLNQTQLPQNALNVTMAYYDDVNGVWVPLESEAGGPPNSVAELSLSAAINHFSIYGILAQLAPTPPAHFVATGLLDPVLSVEKIWETVTFLTKIGESVTIAATITNDGGQSGTYPVELKLDGETVDTKTVTLGAGQSQQVSFTPQSGLDYGQHEVEVAGLSREFTTSRTINWWLIIGIIVAIGLIIWGVAWGRRRRRKEQQEA